MNKKSKIKIVNFDDKNFPKLLKEIPNSPKKIYILGELPSLSDDSPIVAIVGTRKATDYGKQFAKEISKKLAEMGIIVVSGLAMGIDTAAHEGVVAAEGKTIAVLANGLDSIYPAQNENLAKKILEFGGAIISEYEPETPAYQNQFLERNRIVSGLSIATIVIEAPDRSGSLVTARLAAEQGREVFVLPGPANHPNYQGSHKLIRDGARLITSIDDIIEDLGINQNLKIKNQNENIKFKINDKNQLLILKIIKNSGKPINIDEIINIAKLGSQAANQAIAFLTIAGIIKETERGYSL